MNKGDLVISNNKALDYIGDDFPAIVVKGAYGRIVPQESRWDGKILISTETKVVDILCLGRVYKEVPVKYLDVVKQK